MQFKFDDIHELKSLHRMLYESKFTKEPTVGAVSFSPHVANTQRKSFDLIVAADGQNNVEGWRKWQHICDTNTHLIGIFSAKVSGQEWWLKLDESERKKCIEYFFSPHTVDEEIVSELTKCT